MNPPESTLPPQLGHRRLGRAYWRLWTASTVSNLGDGMFLVAMPLLAARTTDDAFAVALVTAANTLPWLLLSLHAGAIVDRHDRRRLLVIGDSFRGALLVLLTVIVAFDVMQIWMLWLLAFCLGIAEVVFDNAAQAILPALVEPDQLEKANGRRYSAELLANVFLGTPLGGALFAVAVWLPFGVDAVGYLAAAVLVFGLRGNFANDAPTGPPQSLWDDVK
ncbi:MAG TPA: MFS transporter, partial [Ilumatobacteraceae bacterium]|nr:MFS transporter [Ilumatobacteraceae bacterium]